MQFLLIFNKHDSDVLFPKKKILNYTFGRQILISKLYNQSSFDLGLLQVTDFEIILFKRVRFSEKIFFAFDGKLSPKSVTNFCIVFPHSTVSSYSPKSLHGREYSVCCPYSNLGSHFDKDFKCCFSSKLPLFLLSMDSFNAKTGCH